ncbi:3-hydroxyacyl-ACP dehydratase [Mucilaginibacter sp. X5P1]|uniref:3-hydroxyacyl-ACP dehydratase n=1 Tax=Mucilaginibacter sp. X5P1 TaxID=2723088 RepID=UPI0016096A24|nr:3-hydroxyacyl-ACP dehydratase [Mucilaginibacter sp. X5P1]MBB6137836.1 putative hotdog family 3-hydroxylacyl-ACP dehydratase [Mucilaginibacter sp. X5P1]
MIFPVEDIIPLIPQKPPFVMVDKLLFVDDDTTRSSLVVKADNVLVKNNHFQEAGLLENIAQTAALRAGYLAHTENKPVKLGYIGAVKDLEIFGLPKVGHELITEITIIDTIFDVTVIAGKVWHKNQLLAQCEMKVFTVNE